MTAAYLPALLEPNNFIYFRKTLIDVREAITWSSRSLSRNHACSTNPAGRHTIRHGVETCAIGWWGRLPLESSSLESLPCTAAIMPSNRFSKAFRPCGSSAASRRIACPMSKHLAMWRHVPVWLCVAAWSHDRASLHGCMAAWLHDCMAAWLQGCRATGLQGCRATEL